MHKKVFKVLMYKDRTQNYDAVVMGKLLKTMLS